MKNVENVNQRLTSSFFKGGGQLTLLLDESLFRCWSVGEYCEWSIGDESFTDQSSSENSIFSGLTGDGDNIVLKKHKHTNFKAKGLGYVTVNNILK